MNIYIDGPDAVGKSTLIKSLKTLLNMETRHLTDKTPNTFTFHKACIKERDNIIYDRFMLAEVIYSEMYKRKPKITMKEVVELMEQIESTNGLMIILYSSSDKVLKQRLIQRHEFQFLDEIGQQNEMYIYCAALLQIVYPDNFITFDVNEEGYEMKMFEAIGVMLGRLKHKAVKNG